MIQPKLLVIGCTNQDINITPVAETHLPGGGGYFSALAASTQLQPVGFVSKIGDDFDRTFLETRVAQDGLHIIPGGVTTTSVQMYHDLHDLTKRDIEIREGVSFNLTPDDIPQHWLKTASHVHVSTLPPLQQQKFLKFIRTQMPDAVVSVDTDRCFFHDPELIESIAHNLRMANIVFLNRPEAEQFAELVQQLPHVVVKKDKDGAQALQHGKVVAKVRVQEVSVQDATGAGDVLAGTYLARLVRGDSPQEALEIACNLATKSVQQEGIGHLFA